MARILSPSSFSLRGILTLSLLISRCIFAEQICPVYNTTLFEQRVDHFGRHNGTFPQRYQLVTDFYKPGGPLLFYQGAEVEYFSCIEYLSLMQYAQETDALLVNINHRYFNDSVPFGPLLNATYDWEYLTLENVMMDSVELVKYVKQKTPSAAAAKTIVAGGSYGGFLSAMLRVNHPETFDGAIASGASVKMDCANFPNTTSQWLGPDLVSNVFEDLSKTVADAINQSWPPMEQMMRAGNATGIKDELSLCTAPSNITELALLQAQLSTGLQRSSQFNYPLAPATSTNVSYPLYYIISQSGDCPSPFTPLKIYTSIGWVAVNPQRSDCYDWTAGGEPGVGGGALSAVPFAYITCTYFPMTCGASRNGNIFPASSEAELVPAPWTEKCRPYGNLHLWTPTEMRELGLSHERLAKTTNIIFPLGQYDPVTGYGVEEFELSADRSAPRRLYVSDMAHTQDMNAYNPLDSQPVMDVRNTSVQYIKAWANLK